MAERSWTVGSSPECDIRVDGAVVSGRHCRLTQRGESFLLEDLRSANGTYVDGERINGPRIVRRGDPVTLGRNTLLPWPPEVVSLTIGRSPDNDFVIPLDMVSGHHARLEREGDEVHLIDLGSSNGTAINEPLNKITRAVIHPADQVFFGTHRVSAIELLRSLPTPHPRQTTVQEHVISDELERELAGVGSPGRKRDVFSPSAWSKFSSPASWALGISLSLLCAILFLGVPRLFRVQAGSLEQDEPINTVLTTDNSPDERNGAATPDSSPPSVVRPEQSRPQQIRPAVSLDEQGIRQYEDAVVLIGVRINDKLVMDSVSGWACRPDAVICPTSTLQMLEQELNKFKGIDASLVVCTPGKTLAILEHKEGRGSAEGFSLAKLEAPLDTACTIAASNVRLEPKQHLAVLAARRDKMEDPQTIVRRFSSVEIDHIEWSGLVPLVIHCRNDKADGALLGAPVFDENGSVVGCVGPSVDGLNVVPVARLQNLVTAEP
jgi:pSer/pThr/pTyr-binding forkhead associated (FHA) protein